MKTFGRGGKRNEGRVVGTKWGFRQYGQCGKHVSDLFPGMRVTGCYQFRVTRNSELFVEDEEVEDLLHALEGELHQRRRVGYLAVHR